MIVRHHLLRYTDVYATDFCDIPFSMMANMTEVYVVHIDSNIYPYRTYRSFFKYIMSVYRIMEPM
jgi:hypothetical protein